MIPSIDPTNQKKTIQAVYNGIYEQVNINLDGSNNEVAIRQLNGRQGDNHRPVNIQLVKNGGANPGDVIPYNFGALYPQIVGKDAEDNVLEFGDDWNGEDPQSGFLNISVPSQAYAAVGLSKNMYLRMIDTDGTVVSSVPIVYETEQDAARLTPGQAQTYMQTIDDMIKATQGNLQSLIDVFATYKAAASGADTDLKALIDAINSKSPALLGATDQKFTGHNTFAGLTTAQNLDVLGLLHLDGFDMQKLIDFFNSYSDTGWTHSATAWLNGATAFAGTSGFWMRRITIGNLRIAAILLACWIPDGSHDLPVVSMPADWVGNVTNNNYFKVPIWAVNGGQPVAFGASINSASQLVISAPGGTNMGVNGVMYFVN